MRGYAGTWDSEDSTLCMLSTLTAPLVQVLAHVHARRQQCILLQAHPSCTLHTPHPLGVDTGYTGTWCSGYSTVYTLHTLPCTLSTGVGTRARHDASSAYYY